MMRRRVLTPGDNEPVLKVSRPHTAISINSSTNMHYAMTPIKTAYYDVALLGQLFYPANFFTVVTKNAIVT